MRLTSARRDWGVAAAVVAGVWLAVWPTLGWDDFSNGSETLVAESALEVRRGDGPTLVPTLMGDPRTRKPPLATWATAAGLSRGAVEGIATAPPGDARDAAYDRLAVELRRTAWLAACLSLLAVFDLGWTLGGPRLGWLAMSVAASTVLFLRFGRSATTDVYLMLFVSIANALLARAVVARGSGAARRRVGWAALAGVAVGLGVLAKGPVALLMTAVPVAAYVAAREWAGGRRANALSFGAPSGGWAWSAAAFVVATVAVGLPWFAYVAATTPGAWATWAQELTRQGASSRAAGSLFTYLLLLPLAGAWAASIVVGAIVLGGHVAARRHRRDVLALFLVVVPTVLMTLFRDREARYLLPLAGPQAVVVAVGFREHLRAWRRAAWVRGPWPQADRVTLTIQYAALLVAAVGLPVAGAVWLRPSRGEPTYPSAVAAIASAVMVAMVGLSLWGHRRWPGGAVAGTVTITLALAATFAWGHRRSEDRPTPMRRLADAIRLAEPSADLVHAGGPGDKRAPEELAIYAARIVRQVPDPASLPIDTGLPTVWLVESRRDEAAAVPPGWRPVASVDDGRRRWTALVRE